eukprot:403925-Prorocentrum_minimum.AAC.1
MGILRVVVLRVLILRVVVLRVLILRVVTIRVVILRVVLLRVTPLKGGGVVGLAATNARDAAEDRAAPERGDCADQGARGPDDGPVSYTHLTLPTILLV